MRRVGTPPGERDFTAIRGPAGVEIVFVCSGDYVNGELRGRAAGCGNDVDLTTFFENNCIAIRRPIGVVE
jgi:hypothetical protein